MSSADITKAATLYQKSIESGLPATLSANSGTYASLQLSLRDMSRALVQNRCVGKGEDGNWFINHDHIEDVANNRAADRAITETYRRATRALDRATPDLVKDGQNALLIDLKRDAENDPQITYQQDTLMRVRPDDMKTLVGASLTLLEAVDKDPANAAFVPGLAGESLNRLDDLMRNAGYLMPGENPERTRPIADQPLRGTPEDQDALYTHLQAMAGNIDLPETINAGDRPATAALALRRAVDSAEVEEITHREAAISMTGYTNSDLSRDQADVLYDYVGASIKLARNAQWNVENSLQTTVLVAPSHVEDTLLAKARYEELGLHDLLASGQFQDPYISLERAQTIAKGLAFIGEAVTTDPEVISYTGDDGGWATMEPNKSGDDHVSEFDNAFDAGDPEAGSELSRLIMSNGKEDMGAEIYGKSDSAVRLLEPILSEGDHNLLIALQDGSIQRIGEIAGRDDAEMWDSRTDQPYAGTLEDAMGAYRIFETAETRGERPANVITTSRRIREDRIRTQRDPNYRPPRRARVREGTDPFRTYRSGMNPKRMTTWLEDNMRDKNGQPNRKLRAFLRDAASQQIETKYEAEGYALAEYARKFVKRDEAEQRLSREAAREKRGITRVDLDAGQVDRMVKVLESARGDDAMVRITYDPNGKVKLFNEDAPLLEGRMNEVPPEIANSSSEGRGRKFGGQLPVSQFKAAVELGEKNVVLLIDGETPYGVIGKEQDRAREARKTRADSQKRDLVLN